MRIREAVYEDLPQIIELLTNDFLGRTRERYCEPLPQCYIDAFRSISEDKNSSIFVVYEEENEKTVVGCFQITFTQYLSHMGSIRATIENVRVNQEKRGCGIGTEMIEYAIAFSKEKGASIIQLMSDKRREKAHDFYKKKGFIASHEGMKLKL